MKPQCSCVVHSGILLTWDPLGRVLGFFFFLKGAMGVARADQGEKRETEKHEWA